MTSESLPTTSDAESFKMGPADPAQHCMAIAQITSKAFANGQYVDEISRQYIGNSHYDWATTRLIWDNDQLIHHWGVWGYPMRLGSIQLKVAGIGAVVTEEAYRKRGLMTRAARASFEAMRTHDYDLTILRGRYYTKFGYVRAWNYVTYRLKLDEIPQRELQQPYTPLGPEHMDQIIALYNQHYADFSGTAVRPTYRMLATGDMGAYGWFDAHGDLIGYVRAMPTSDKETLQCLEAAGDPDQALAILAELFRQEETYKTLTFFTMPYAHPMLKIIRRGACIIEDRYFYHSGWQVRLVNLTSTLTKLRPLLEERLKQSHLANWQGTILLDAGDHRAGLDIAHGTVALTPGDGEAEHALHAGPALARFLIGSDDPQEIIEQEQVRCTGRAAELAAVLFPNMQPMLSHWDEY